MFESGSHLRSVVDETRNIMRLHVSENILAVIIELIHMNPHMIVGIPRSTLRSRLAIGVVARSPTNGNGDAIRESHGEPMIDGMLLKVEARERIGDGRSFGRHACIIPNFGAVVKPNLCCRWHLYGVYRKRHTELEGKAHPLAHTSHRSSRKWFD